MVQRQKSMAGRIHDKMKKNRISENDKIIYIHRYKYIYTVYTYRYMYIQLYIELADVG
jgi:hypothetical protein